MIKNFNIDHTLSIEKLPRIEEVLSMFNRTWLQKVGGLNINLCSIC